jgi:hypothetical protein
MSGWKPAKARPGCSSAAASCLLERQFCRTALPAPIPLLIEITEKLTFFGCPLFQKFKAPGILNISRFSGMMAHHTGAFQGAFR